MEMHFFSGHNAVASLIWQRMRKEQGGVGRRWEMSCSESSTGFALCCVSPSRGAVLAPGRVPFSWERYGNKKHHKEGQSLKEGGRGTQQGCEGKQAGIRDVCENFLLRNLGASWQTWHGKWQQPQAGLRGSCVLVLGMLCV